MATVKEYIINIEGVTPLIQDRLSRELIAERKKIPKDKLDDWENENYIRKITEKTRLE